MKHAANILPFVHFFQGSVQLTPRSVERDMEWINRKTGVNHVGTYTSPLNPMNPILCPLDN